MSPSPDWGMGCIVVNLTSRESEGLYNLLVLPTFYLQIATNGLRSSWIIRRRFLCK
jgi:hypothetical protein